MSYRYAKKHRFLIPVAVCLCVGALAFGATLVGKALSHSTFGATNPTKIGNTPQVASAVAAAYSVSDTPESTSKAPTSSQRATEQSTAQATNTAANDWRLVLVNSKNRLEKDYDVTLAGIADYKVDKRIVEDLSAMLAAAKADGYTLKLYSAYRPMERSRVLYNGKVNEYIALGYSRAAAEKEAARWIAPPGTSEHNTGLSVDLISDDYFTKFNDLVHEFDTCPEFTWLYKNCATYGFVLRYPKDKQEITGITYEPWHYRYVGREAAQKIMEQKICLEEYLAQ